MKPQVLVFVVICSFLFCQNESFGDEAFAPDHFRHQARELETIELNPKQVQDATDSPRPQENNNRASLVVPPADKTPAGQSVSSENEKLHFFNNASLLSQEIGSTNEGMKLGIVNGSAVTGPVLHSRTLVIRQGTGQTKAKK